ncbi:MAG: hypothetical protein ACI8SE_002215 [Bacteroidia bacterium]|jgi:hypothetical protein
MEPIAFYITALIILFPIQAGISACHRWILKVSRCDIYHLTIKQLKYLTMINVTVVGILAIPHRSLILFITSIAIGLILFITNAIYNYKPLVSPINSSWTFNLFHIFNLCIHPSFLIAWVFSSVTAGVFDDLGWMGYK